MVRSPWNARRIAFALAAWAALALGCPKSGPPPDPTPAPPSPAEAVVAIDKLVPSKTVVGRAVTVSVTGHGFEEEMDVRLGKEAAVGLDVLGPRELTLRVTETLPAGSYDLEVVRADGERAVRRGAFIVEPDPAAPGDCVLQTVLFQFDEASLSNDARRLLAENARCIESRRLVAVRVEGHADERGSTVYNLALAERRAEAVRSYLLNIGVGGARLTNLSYGEERPIEPGDHEAAWARNRRVEFAIP